MSSRISLTIPGPPIAKKRPRFARIGKGVRTYSVQDTEEGRFLLEIKRQWHGEPIDGPVAIRITFVMPIPRSTSKKRARLMAEGDIRHIKKPDLDNLEKFAADCLKGVAWRDDSQVVESVTRKIYGQNPRTEIEIEAWESRPLLSSGR